MPIFEYICLDCSRKFEELVMRSDAVITCPACHSMHVSKLVSVFSSSAVPAGASCSPSSCGKSSFG